MKRKTTYLLSAAVLILSACSSSSQSQIEGVITEYFETKSGVHVDLKAEFQSTIISDVTVLDSVQIIQDLYEKEKARRIATYEEAVKLHEENIAKNKERNDLIGRSVIASQASLYEAEKRSLEQARAWKPEILNLYDGRDTKEVLVKKAVCTFSVLNPQIQTRMTFKDAVFILSPDGKTCLQMIINSDK